MKEAATTRQQLDLRIHEVTVVSPSLMSLFEVPEPPKATSHDGDR